MGLEEESKITPTIFAEQEEIIVETYPSQNSYDVDYPTSDLTGVVGNDGYEWLNYPPGSQTHYYRIPGSGEWTIWDK